MTAANWITLSRIALIPIFMVALSIEGPYSATMALSIFIVASLTDAVDGYVARKFNQITTFGKFMDPLADKLLVATAVIYLVHGHMIAPWAAAIIIAREFAVTSLRMVAISEGRVIAAGLSGKIKTAVQIVCIVVLLAPLSLYEHSIGVVSYRDIAAWVMAAVALWSGVDYIIRHKDIIKIKN